VIPHCHFDLHLPSVSDVMCIFIYIYMWVCFYSLYSGRYYMSTFMPVPYCSNFCSFLL
jgi:hypothetical protein